MENMEINYDKLVEKALKHVVIEALKIADDNKESLKVASSCGYEWIEKDYYAKLEARYPFTV